MPPKSGPIEIMDSLYLVSPREGVLLERNTYLRVFKRGGREVNMLVDPGSPHELDKIVENVSMIIGDFRKVNLIFVNHQDPDVSANVSFFLKANPKAVLITSEDTWRLISLLGISEKNYKPVERFKDMQVILTTGHKLIFVPTPFCHFRGAVALFDVENRVLFTGDLFGGLSFERDDDVYAKSDKDFEGIVAFHQIYMPSKEAIENAVKNIRKLNPNPVMIAPQHGKVIVGELIEKWMNRLVNINVGLDIINQRFKLETYIVALNEILKEVGNLLGISDMSEWFKIFKDQSFPAMFIADRSGIKEIKIEPLTALDLMVGLILEKAPPQHVENIKKSIFKTLVFFGLTIPESLSFAGTKADTVELFEE